MRSFTFYKQHDAMDCGPACLRMVAKHYGKNVSADTLRTATGFSKEGVSLLGISEAAEKIGFHTAAIKLPFEKLREAPLPAIIHWEQNHFVVVVKMTRRKNFLSGIRLTIADPARGIVLLKREEFLQSWAVGNGKNVPTGAALLLEPTKKFYDQPEEKKQGGGWKMVNRYLLMQKKLLLQLIVGFIAGSALQLSFPFLTQSIVDTGIVNGNLSFITLILLAQLMLFFSRTLIEFIRIRTLLYISSRINLGILSDFWVKLMNLPLSFFDTRNAGDIMQRLGDHKRIESFLTGSVLSTFFSMINLFIFAIVLLIYDHKIFLIYVAAAILYYLWIKLFLKFRRRLDYQNFSLNSKSNSETLDLVQGMHEIKLNSGEQVGRWKWERLQASIFMLDFKRMSINQYQQAGAFFINEGKNILITFIVATAVINGELTLGAMLAIQFIIGQLNSPVEQLISFVQAGQDARISLERLNEIHQLKDEEDASLAYTGEQKKLHTSLPVNKSITLQDLSFTYTGAGNLPVLKNLSLTIPAGKTTAIVGVSGSGKTTVLKLLLRFYDHYEGKVLVGDTDLKSISPAYWRSQCGVVLQEGYIFNDSIARNIAVSDEQPDRERMEYAARIANIDKYIESLPMQYDTKIGIEGNGISAGQRQRIFIARMIYKDPEYIFLDEATNALDASNEKTILENMSSFLKGKTAVVVAHRLSTVKNADNIIVLQNGRVCEEGGHEELSKKKGIYYQLVQNQLELGN